MAAGYTLSDTGPDNQAAGATPSPTAGYTLSDTGPGAQSTGGLGHQAGLTARAVAEGLPPWAVGDMLNAGINWTLRKVTPTGSQSYQLPMPSQVVSSALTDAGVATPQNSMERQVLDVNKGVLSVLAPIKGAGIASDALASPVVADVNRVLAANPLLRAPGLSAFDSASGNIARIMASNPGLQAVSGGASAAGGSMAREQGGTPDMQTLMSLLFGVGAPMAWQGGATLGSLVKRGIAPVWSKDAQAGIVGKTLTDLAHDPASAIAEMSNARSIVPGSLPTAAQASGDPGLLSAERSYRSLNPGFNADFTINKEAQNRARAGVLQGMGADSNPQATGQTVQSFLTQKLAGAEAARDAQALPYLHEMQTNPQPVDVSPIVNTIDASLAGPAGKRGNVSDALGAVREMLLAKPDPNAVDVTQLASSPAAQQQIAATLRAKGIPIAGSQLESDPNNLYAIRQEINDMISGRVDAMRQGARFASRELLGIRGMLDDAITQTNPTFRKYLDTYREQSAVPNQLSTGAMGSATATDQFGNLTTNPERLPSKFLNSPTDMNALMTQTAGAGPAVDALRQEALGRLFNRGLTGQTTSTGERMMTQGSYSRAFNSALPDLQRVLTPGQLLQAKQVADDIDRAAMSDTIGKVAGSDTMKNMSMANLIGSMTGGHFTKLPGFIQNTVGRPLKWIMEAPEDAVQQLLSQAMMDPALATAMMRSASAGNARVLDGALRDKAGQIGLGWLFSPSAHNVPNHQ